MRFSVLQTVLLLPSVWCLGRMSVCMCSPVLRVCAGACMCAPYVKCGVGSVTGQSTSLTYLTFFVSPSTPMSRSRMKRKRKREIGPNISISASPARARVEPECLWETECCWTWRRTCVRHEKRRPRSTASSGKSGGRSRSALLPERVD